MSDAQRLTDLLRRDRLLVAPGVYDGLSAAVASRAGVEAAYLSGAAVSAGEGLPDIGLTTVTEIARAVSVVRRQLDVPVIADADTGFGDETHTFRTVRTYEDAGAAAVQLEDQVFPKRCGHLDDKALISADEFVLKIGAALAARRRGALIVARTDAIAVEGFDAAITRAKRYAAAGADVIFVEAPQTLEQVAAIPTAIDVPVIFNVVPGGKSPEVSREQLQEFGYAGAILPGATVGAAFDAMTRAMTDIAAGSLSSGPITSPRALFAAVGLDAWAARRTPKESARA
ncbi:MULTISPECIES: isocitrate lyase/PEP mutase family protein [Streptomyces]|jgi:2-methylisocitrate lyase-like PEP mutase family enzyme|uniref:Isocitrate lyase/PEP mutase family protein n=1 Tax=Streptomyces edwardsiae TaxID=3075527 RepID=A0ABU2PS82_9ACTN|nr:isocitrate lyase/PEP mutase family protein [Streptomyces sp. DSM 41636]MDT0393615.1 isocitrate lyase/PEP mutase family protein [Streptomyces sp. DSM 41636]